LQLTIKGLSKPMQEIIQAAIIRVSYYARNAC
jgi:hypothetical protein